MPAGQRTVGRTRLRTRAPRAMPDSGTGGSPSSVEFIRRRVREVPGAQWRAAIDAEINPPL